MDDASFYKYIQWIKGLLTCTNQWSKQRGLVLPDWFSLPDSLSFYFLWGLCLWSGSPAPSSWSRSPEWSSDHPCNCGFHKVRGRNPTCGRQTSGRQTTASCQSPLRGNPAPVEWGSDMHVSCIFSHFQRSFFSSEIIGKTQNVGACQKPCCCWLDRLTCPSMIMVDPRMFEPAEEYFFIRGIPSNHSCTSPDVESHVVHRECHMLGL